jgi:hypothetical protein
MNVKPHFTTLISVLSYDLQRVTFTLSSAVLQIVANAIVYAFVHTSPPHTRHRRVPQWPQFLCSSL